MRGSIWTDRALLDALPAAERVIAAWNSGNTVDWYRKALGEANLRALRIGSDAPSHSRPQPTVDDDELQDIATAVDELGYEVDASELDSVTTEKLQRIIDGTAGSDLLVRC